MPVKLRLARHGRKGRPFYHIVAADSRAPRDGRYIERVGSYNPNTNPATIVLDFDRSLDWLNDGAQPTDTVRAILSHEGVMMKKHLLAGAKKGAFTVEQAEEKYSAWKAEKENKVQAKVDGLANTASEEAKARFDAETAVSQKRAEAIAKRAADAAAEIEAAAKAEAAEGEEATEEAAENTEA